MSPIILTRPARTAAAAMILALTVAGLLAVGSIRPAGAQDADSQPDSVSSGEEVVVDDSDPDGYAPGPDTGVTSPDTVVDSTGGEDGTAEEDVETISSVTDTTGVTVSITADEISTTAVAVASADDTNTTDSWDPNNYWDEKDHHHRGDDDAKEPPVSGFRNTPTTPTMMTPPMMTPPMMKKVSPPKAAAPANVPAPAANTSRKLAYTGAETATIWWLGFVVFAVGAGVAVRQRHTFGK